MYISDTSSLPDISLGNRVSRKADKLLFTFLLRPIVLKSGVTIEVNSLIFSELMFAIDIEAMC